MVNWATGPNSLRAFAQKESPFDKATENTLVFTVSGLSDNEIRINSRFSEATAPKSEGFRRAPRSEYVEFMSPGNAPAGSTVTLESGLVREHMVAPFAVDPSAP